MKCTNHVDLLRGLGASAEVIEWCEGRGSEEAWRDCQRGDWMLWIASKSRVDRKRIVRAICDCVEPALRFVPDGEGRPRAAIDTARAWCRGLATHEEVWAAASAAADASVGSDAADAAYATAYATAYAAAAAAAAAYAANDAAYADAAAVATHAADAVVAVAAAYATSAADDAARLQSLAASADIVRRHIPWDVVREALSKLEA